MFKVLTHATFCLFAGTLMQISSCPDTDILDDLTDELTGDSGGSSGNDSTPASDEIRVRLLNQTDWALDVQFYASAEIGDPGTVLFAPANKITSGLGFAGTGLIPANDRDELLLACTDAQMVGTLGGEFLDADTGELAGNAQQRVLTLDQQYICGETITIIFQEDDGEFTTSLLLD